MRGPLAGSPLNQQTGNLVPVCAHNNEISMREEKPRLVYLSSVFLMAIWFFPSFLSERASLLFQSWGPSMV